MLPVSYDHVKIPWCKRNLIELRRRPIVKPPTPPGEAPGVEYLDGSPFGGEKEINEGPYNTSNNTGPGYRAYTVPLRNLDAGWGAEGGTSGLLKKPSKDTTLVDWNSATTPEITDLTVREWRMVDSDIHEASWSDILQGGGEYSHDGVGMSLSTMLAEELYTGLWCLSHFTKNPYPGYAAWQINRVSMGMDIAATNTYKSTNNWGYPSFYPADTDNNSRYIRPIYHLILYKTAIQYLYCVTEVDIDGDGIKETSSHWHEKALAPYDIRDQFFAAVATSDMPFFKRFRECQSSYATIINQIKTATHTDSEGAVVLTFMIDTKEGVI